MKSPLISIIIPNYNGEKFLKTCLSSVIKSSYSNFEVIIVDDGSTDKSIDIINRFRRKDKRILLLKNEKNLGAAASRNKAAKIAKGEILVFLDNDTEVDREWLTAMVNVLLSKSSVGACQAKLFDFKKRKLFQNIGVKLWAGTGWGLPIGQWEEDRGQYDFEEDIVGISAALAVKKNVFEKVGGFDELEAVVTEDLDLCWRIWIAGYRVVRAPKSIVYHWTKPVSMRKNMKHSEEVIYFHLTKNSLTSILKNYQIYNAIKYFFYSLFISLSRSLAVFIRRGDFSAVKGTVMALWWEITNLGTILKKRQYIQKYRVYKDNKLFDIILLRRSFLEIYLRYFSQTKLLYGNVT